MMRSRPRPARASSGKQSSPPASLMSSETQPMPLMSGSSHSSEYTRGRRGHAGPRPHTSRDFTRQRSRPPLAADHAAERADHAQNVGDAAMVEHVHLEPG